MRSSGRNRVSTDDYIIPLPRNLALDIEGLLAAATMDDFIRLTPKGLLRQSLERAVETYGDQDGSFFVESVLDQEYLGSLLALVEKLPDEDRNHMRPMCRQEADIFHLMVVLRGKFFHQLDGGMLLPLHIPGSKISRSLFEQMLKEQDAYASVERAAGSLFDAPPPEPTRPDTKHSNAWVDAAALERLAWNRFARLANLAFRQSHVRLGTILGYVGLRRVEVANLITLSEGIKRGLSPEAIGARMITYPGQEAFRA
jgi:vacuolar-type H+-ATPase subunit C/Vma6